MARRLDDIKKKYSIHFQIFPGNLTGSQSSTVPSAAILNKKTGNVLYVDVARNVQERFRNHCCSGKATSITYSECVFVALGIQHVMRVPYVVIGGLSGSTAFFHIVS